MGIVTQFLEPKAATFGPLEDFWYRDIGPASASGVRINPETALAVSTVFACVRIISQTLAMLPLVVYQRLPNGGKERASSHPLFDVLHSRPNVRQSSFQFREMLMGHVVLRGNAYARIVPGSRGFADQLVPLHPERVTPRLADNGGIQYEYRPLSGITEILLQDEVFHLSTLSDDGVQGLSLVTLAKDSFGLAAAVQNYANRFYSEGQRPAGVLKTPGHLSPEGHERLRTDWKERHGGLAGSQNIAILEDGLEWQALGLTNEDAQQLETRAFQVEEIASWFGVPLSLLQHTEKSTSWGTGITQLTLGFVQFTMQPWLIRWEQEISQDLIINKDRFFAEFVLEGLLRGDPATRSSFYATMIDRGVYTRNEVRRLENLNPLPGLDDPLTPLNMQQGQRSNALALALARDTAARMARKESASIQRAAEKYAGDPAGWAVWLTEFYDGFRADLMEVCKLKPHVALTYTLAQRDELLAIGAGAVDGWEQDRKEKLVSLMVGD